MSFKQVLQAFLTSFVLSMRHDIT